MTFSKAKKAEVNTTEGVQVAIIRSFGVKGLFGTLRGKSVMIAHKNFISWVN